MAPSYGAGRRTMLNQLVGGIVLLSFVVTARDGAAQEAPDTARASAARVRIHVLADRGAAKAIVESRDAPDQYTLLCTSEPLRLRPGGVRRPYRPWAPCVADVEANSQLRVTVDEHGHDVVVPSNGGDALRIEVVPESRTSAAPGVVLISLGGATAVIGLLLAGFSSAISPGNDESTAFLAAGALGGAVVAGGIVTLVTRDTVPAHVVVEPIPRARGQTSLRDLASARSREPMTSAPFTPLTWGFTF